MSQVIAKNIGDVFLRHSVVQQFLEWGIYYESVDVLWECGRQVVQVNTVKCLWLYD